MFNFPPEILALPDFKGQFTAKKLAANDCDVLFASYPEGTFIPEHKHDTNNVGVVTKGAIWLSVEGSPEVCYKSGDWYHVPAQAVHTARFEVETEEIEFWFKRAAT